MAIPIIQLHSYTQQHCFKLLPVALGHAQAF